MKNYISIVRLKNRIVECECRRETIRDEKKIGRGQERLEQLNRLPTEKTKCQNSCEQISK
jgi:hypothetical protein